MLMIIIKLRPKGGNYIRRFMLDVLHQHDDVIKWKHFPRYWPFVRGIHRHRWIPLTKDSDAELWYFSLICSWINGRVNNLDAGDLRRHRVHYDVTVMDGGISITVKVSIGMRDYILYFYVCVIS